MCKLRKALYKFKSSLLEHGYEIWSIDKTLFTLRHGNDFLLVQIYVNDIIYGGYSHTLVAKFVETISREYEISMMDELNFFLGL